MGLFQRKSSRVPAGLPGHLLGQLADYGRADLEARVEGRPMTDESFGWDGFTWPFTQAMLADRSQTIAALHHAALSSPDRAEAMLGAHRIVAGFNPEIDDAQYLQIYDEALELLHARGLTRAQLTGVEMRRWAQTRGSWDG